MLDTQAVEKAVEILERMLRANGVIINSGKFTSEDAFLNKNNAALKLAIYALRHLNGVEQQNRSLLELIQEFCNTEEDKQNFLIRAEEIFNRETTDS